MRTQTIGLGLTTLIAVSAGGSALAQTNIEKLKQMKVASADLNIPPVPQTGPERRRHSPEPRTHQVAARIQDFSLCDRAGRAAHGGRAVHEHAVRGHAQDHGVGRDESQQRRGCNRSEAICTFAEVFGTQRRVLDEGWVPDRGRAQSHS